MYYIITQQEDIYSMYDNSIIMITKTIEEIKKERGWDQKPLEETIHDRAQLARMIWAR